MRSIIGITILLLVAVGAVAWLYFSNLTTDSRSTERALAVIPGDAAIIMRMSNDRSSFDLLKDYELFADLAGEKKQKELSSLKTLVAGNSDIYSATQEQNIFISIHPATGGGSAFMYTMPLKKAPDEHELDRLISSAALNREASGNGILSLRGNSLPGTLYVGLMNNVLVASFDKKLTVQALDPNAQKLNPGFLQEMSQTLAKETSTLINVFLNHAQPGFLNNYVGNSISGNLGLFKSFEAYSSFSMNFKSNALMLNGTTELRKGQSGYISLFLKQQPTANTIRRVIPYNVANSICYGVSDYGLFHQGVLDLLGQRREKDSLNMMLAAMTTETGVDPQRDIRPLWGSEFSNIQLSTHETMAIVRVSNSTQLGFYLEPLSEPYSDIIRKLNYPNLLYYYFGDPMKKFERPFFVVRDNLLIISNSPGTLQRYINDYENDRLIANYSAYTRFSQYVADQGNISFFMHSRNSESLVKSWLKKPYADDFLAKDAGMGRFYGLSFQLTSNKTHFFTNFYLDDIADVTVKPDSSVYTNSDID